MGPANLSCVQVVKPAPITLIRLVDGVIGDVEYITGLHVGTPSFGS
jgi:hypothetical protein